MLCPPDVVALAAFEAAYRPDRPELALRGSRGAPWSRAAARTDWTTYYLARLADRSVPVLVPADTPGSPRRKRTRRAEAEAKAADQVQLDGILRPLAILFRLGRLPRWTHRHMELLERADVHDDTARALARDGDCILAMAVHPARPLLSKHLPADLVKRIFFVYLF